MKTTRRCCIVTIIFFVICSKTTAQLKVQGTQLRDACGNTFQLIGINKMSIWKDRQGTSIPEIAKTGANCVRIVWKTKFDDDFNDATPEVPTSASELENLIVLCQNSGMIPVVDNHSATGAWSLREDLMEFWERPDIISLMKKYEKFIIINIGNELGGHHDGITDMPANDQEYIDWYKGVISRLRTKGVKVPIMIDAPNDGKDMEYINRVARQLLVADPNLIFSVHTYWSNFDINNIGKSPSQFVNEQFGAVKDLPMVIGELSKYGGDGNGIDKQCGNTNEVSYSVIANECKKRGFGYIAWEWGPGNSGGGDPLCEKMDMTDDGAYNGLMIKNNWGLELVNNPTYGIKANAKLPSDIFCENVKLNVSLKGNARMASRTYAWSSCSSDIQSYVLEVEQRTPPLNKSVKFPANASIPLQSAYQYSIGMAFAKLKVFRKDGSTCYVKQR